MNGGVDVNTAAGPVTAETVNGNVDARMASLQGNDDMSFKTVNGSVAIYVPARFDANFRFDTVHGGIDSDFPMTLSGRWGPRHASGTIGSGGRDHKSKQRERQHRAEKAVSWRADDCYRDRLAAPIRLTPT